MTIKNKDYETNWVEFWVANNDNSMQYVKLKWIVKYWQWFSINNNTMHFSSQKLWEVVSCLIKLLVIECYQSQILLQKAHLSHYVLNYGVFCVAKNSDLQEIPPSNLACNMLLVVLCFIIQTMFLVKWLKRLPKCIMKHCKF